MKRILLSLCLLTFAGAASPVAASAAVGDQLLVNPGLEAPDATSAAPAWWSAQTWTTTTTNPPVVTFTWSSDAHSGKRSARVEVSGYTDGDSKWVPEPVEVTGGAYYTFSDWYKSSASTAISVYYELDTDTDTDADGLINGHWANLFSGVPAASEWTQYKTGFTMPPGAVRAQFVHFIARNGWLQTDDYSLTEERAPAGFSKPMISLTFDDGSKGYWENARPLVNAKGFKTTQYIPTGGLTSNPLDPFLMTRDQITTLAREGNEIGAHSVTHPLLTTRTDAELANELVTSKDVLEAIPGVGTIRNFAYPFGDYDARVIEAEKQAGYRSGRSVEEGYNSTLDLELYDIRVQNITWNTTPAQLKSWVDYAKAHNYWLVLVYHEVVPDSAPRCTNPETDPDVCLAEFDTTVSGLKNHLDYISSAGLAKNVLTVQQALDIAENEMHGPVAGTVKITPAGAGHERGPDGDPERVQRPRRRRADVPVSVEGQRQVGRRCHGQDLRSRPGRPRRRRGRDHRRRQRERPEGPPHQRGQRQHHRRARPEADADADAEPGSEADAGPEADAGSKADSGPRSQADAGSGRVPAPAAARRDAGHSAAAGGEPRHHGAAHRNDGPDGAPVQGRHHAEGQDRLHGRAPASSSGRRPSAAVATRRARCGRARSCACRARAATSCT